MTQSINNSTAEQSDRLFSHHTISIRELWPHKTTESRCISVVQQSI